VDDYFLLLEQPRRPWLDPEQVQAKFLQLSMAVHPDRVHGAAPAERERAQHQFAALNLAAACLKDPKARLRHLIQLETGSAPGQLERLPANAPEFYFRIGQVCRDVDGCIAARPASPSPLLKAQFFSRAMEWLDKLEQLQQQLQTQRAELQKQIMALNAHWEAAPPVGTATRQAALPLDDLTRLYRELSYTMRWSGQITERTVQLSV
jgi:DnaJ-domain-containing protein 1